uniref:Uncharacterized protein n=1 Tax=Oryza brachyantha TaxID=4533 RepID=J3MYX8_ORYBR
MASYALRPALRRVAQRVARVDDGLELPLPHHVHQQLRVLLVRREHEGRQPLLGEAHPVEQRGGDGGGGGRDVDNHAA